MMTIKEAERLGVMKEITKKKITYEEGSQILELSRRQTIRIMKRYRVEGARGVISRKRGIKSPRKISDTMRIKILSIIRERYPDFGPSFACEKLKEKHHIVISRETLRQWLIKEDLWKAKKKKEVKIYPRRTRRSQVGELIQIDGSYHHWFEERGEKCCLLLFIDDATSCIMEGRFCKTETTKDYMEGLKSYIHQHGKPQALYSDKHSIFRVNKKEVENGVRETQFGKALNTLKIELICANSPQAKGRVERANGTLQDRLVKELRLEGCCTIEEGNRYLPEFIKKFNQKFGQTPATEKDGHRVLKENLDEILVNKAARKLSKDLSFQYQNNHYQVESKTPNRLRYKSIEIIEAWDKPIMIKYQGQELNYRLWKEQLDCRPAIMNEKDLEVMWNFNRGKKPSKRHPWR